MQEAGCPCYHLGRASKPADLTLLNYNPQPNRKMSGVIMSSKGTRIFEIKDDKSSKFWEITQTGSTVTVRYGKTGTNGRIQEKSFQDETSAQKQFQKLIAE